MPEKQKRIFFYSEIIIRIRFVKHTTKIFEEGMREIKFIFINFQ